jgi:hypothetical protein
VDGLKIALMHGTEEPLVRAVLASQLYDVLVRGHNHIFEVSSHGRTMLVNPGEIWGHLTGYSTVAILDTTSMEVERVELGRFKTYREIIEG